VWSKDGVHGVEGGQVVLIKLQLGNKKEKNKTMEIRAEVLIGFCFALKTP
jgi:hypothetical protein